MDGWMDGWVGWLVGWVGFIIDVHYFIWQVSFVSSCRLTFRVNLTRHANHPHARRNCGWGGRGLRNYTDPVCGWMDETTNERTDGLIDWLIDWLIGLIDWQLLIDKPCARVKVSTDSGVILAQKSPTSFRINTLDYPKVFLHASLLTSFPCKINTFRKRVKNVVTNKGIQVGIDCK
jgi:hypothetical protein